MIFRYILLENATQHSRSAVSPQQKAYEKQGLREPGETDTKTKDFRMKLTYDEIVRWMKEYFAAYNAYAQNPRTVHRMSDFFTENVRFVPYISDFGGPEKAVTSRDDFFRMFTGHPTVYEKFEVEDIAVDERRLVAVALLKVALFDSITNEVLLKKHYLPRYQLVLDEAGALKISTILFFWEALPPEMDKAYAIEKPA